MKRLNCEETKEDLKAYLDYELTPLRRWAVSRHVAICADCQKELKEMVQVAEEITSKNDDTVHEIDKQHFAGLMKSAVPPVAERPRHPKRVLAIAVASFAGLLVAVGIFGPEFKEHSVMYSDSQSSPVPSPFVMADRISPQSGHRFGDASGRIDLKMPATAVANAQMSPAPDMNAKAMDQPAASPVVPSDESGYDAGRQVHKSATITVQVKDPESVGEQVENTAKAAGGFVTTSDLTTASDGTKSYTMTVKVPLPQFEATLAQISKLGSVQDKEVTGEDITAQVSDADSREQVLEQDMNQALDQLKKKGSHASWDLQQDARDLRIQLAQSRARLQLLHSLSELSEIDVTLAQPSKPAAAVQTGFLADLTNSGHGALQAASGALVTLIALLLWILAYSPLWIPTLLVGRWLWRRYNGDPKSEAPTQS